MSNQAQPINHDAEFLHDALGVDIKGVTEKLKQTIEQFGEKEKIVKFISQN